MDGRRLVTGWLTGMLLATAGLAGAQPPLAEAPGPAELTLTPPRVGFVSGGVSFWRPGADAWSPAAVNLPLAPGDVLYAGTGGTVEIQTGPRTFLRGGEGAQVALDRQEPGLVQYRVTGGPVALDRRDGPGLTIALAAPGLALAVEQPGYYRLTVAADRATVAVHQGGRATVTLAEGGSVPVLSGQEVTVVGLGPPALDAAPPLTAWDEWNRARTEALVATRSPYVPAEVYGSAELERYGGWRPVEPYGPVWVPAAVPAGWAPYSTGRWIFDPRYGWTWLDDAPWGWAPYHHGRWVFVDGYWAWAPGPVVVQPVYAPALVVFLGSPVIVTSPPLCWVALGWGEPVVPWWGSPGFVGRPSWRGWGGPRVVNHVVVHHTTVVEARHLRQYRNQQVPDAVVAVEAGRFGREHVTSSRVRRLDASRLTPLVGALPATVTPASLRPRDVSPPGVSTQRGPARTIPPIPRIPRSGEVPATRAPGPTGPARVPVPSSSPGRTIGPPAEPPRAAPPATTGRWQPDPPAPPKALPPPGTLRPGAPASRPPAAAPPAAPGPGRPVTPPRIEAPPPAAGRTPAPPPPGALPATPAPAGTPPAAGRTPAPPPPGAIPATPNPEGGRSATPRPVPSPRTPSGPANLGPASRAPATRPTSHRGGGAPARSALSSPPARPASQPSVTPPPPGRPPIQPAVARPTGARPGPPAAPRPTARKATPDTPKGVRAPQPDPAR